MKTQSLIFATICIITIMSCNQKKIANQETTTDSLVIDERVSIINENKKCFMASLGKDTVLMDLKIKETKVEGAINYNFFEKDKNTGTVEGNINQDTLNLIYTFSSEGSISTRPLKMIIKKNQIFEIYGDEIAKEGKGFIYNIADCKN